MNRPTRCLPPGVVNQTGPVLDQPKGYGFGWMTQILPYFEHEERVQPLQSQGRALRAGEPDHADEPGAELPLSLRRRADPGHRTGSP